MFSHRVNHIVPPLIRGFLLNGVLLLIALPPVSHSAQNITLDGSLGTQKALDGPNYAITHDLGQIRGSNLFHSFGIFNLVKGETATFSGPNSIANILSRVTGGKSSIDGTLKSTIAGANLYLLNPAGVLFGPNASLDLSGSFHVTTANYLGFANDTYQFHATPTPEPVLTSAPPAAFGFLGPTPAPISIDQSVLQVPAGETLSLVGGDIMIVGGTLTAPTNPPFDLPSFKVGRIALAALGSGG